MTKCCVAAELLACCIYEAHSSLGRRDSSHCFLVRFLPTSAAHKRRRSFVAYPRPGQVNLPGTGARQRLPSRTTLGPPGLAVSGDTTLLRRFGETFHCRPSSVMTVTGFLL